jgi:hypothetical protein
MSQKVPNPTKPTCPSDIAALSMTDWRQNKALYSNILNNNDFRLYLQRNANQIRKMQLDQFHDKMSCTQCEQQPSGIVPFKNQFK